jgi:hypothetical protein
MSAPMLPLRLFNFAGAIFVAGFTVFAFTSWTLFVIAGSLALGLTNLYDVATRWRDPAGNPRYRNTTIPGTTYRISPALEIGLETLGGVILTALGVYLTIQAL